MNIMKEMRQQLLSTCKIDFLLSLNNCICGLMLEIPQIKVSFILKL